MTRKKRFRIFVNALVVAIGFFIGWNLPFFKPFSANYPPNCAYKITDVGLSGVDSVLAAPGLHYRRSRFAGFWLGKHYRALWEKPVKVPVLNLAHENGGLKITKRGGGMQTIGFTLKDKTGKAYTLRSADKDPVRMLPRFWRPTVVSGFVRDQVSATDPYAALVVAGLSEKAGIPHVAPKLVFVMPGDRAFGQFGLHNGGFYYLSLKSPPTASLANTARKRLAGTYSSEEMLEILEKNPGKAALDTALFLKCRLFDLVISDWDRHAGQWNWVAFLVKSDTVFRPVPKDRDQAFGNYQDGVLPFILTREFIVPKITSFTPNYEDMEGFAQNGSVLDKQFLQHVPLAAFEEASRQLQTSLTDSSLLVAIRKYPKQVYALIGLKNYETLKARREKLPEAAREFYRIVRQYAQN